MLTAAVATTLGLLAPSAGAVASQGEIISPTSTPVYDDTIPADTIPDDTFYDDTIPDDTFYADTIPGEAFYEEPAVPGSPGTTIYDALIADSIGDPCDPEVYPAWASDPYCNPDIESFETPATTLSRTSAPDQFRGERLVRSADNVPLTEIDSSEAQIVGAGRMLLVIDAIAELGGFERAVTPGGAALLRDIRQGVPAAGLDETGYSQELQAFVVDFIPFLESLEADGVTVSADLWEAALGLHMVVFDEIDTVNGDPDELGLLEPRPWLHGLADLLVRGGESQPIPTLETDEAAIRDLLAAFAAEPPQTTSTTVVPEDESPPPALALDAAADSADTGSDNTPVLLAAFGVVAALLVGFVVFWRRRRSNRRPTSSNSALHPGTAPTSGGSTPPTPAATSKASVTELLDASRRMSASLDPATIASIALAEAKRIVDAEGGIVVRRTDNGLDPVGCEPPMLFNYKNITEGCLPRVVETGQSTAAIAHDEPLLVEVPMAMGAVPIVTDGVVTGAILVVRVSAKPFDREELDALEMLAPLVGSAFAVADTHETAVDVEPLTGLHNRRRLDLDLASISTEEEVAYVMVDIDHFKNFNDTNGHAAGDEALRQVSALLQASVRPNDLVYRYGGEEFCVLLPATSADEAAVVAERARAAVEAAQIPGMEHQPDGVVTISVGVSDSAFGSPDDLVERADAALYVSKRNGRNRVTLSPTD